MTNKLLAVLALACASLALIPGKFARSMAQPPAQSGAQSADESKGVDQDVAMLRRDVRAQKKQIVAANVKLTETEATKFWPVYDRYTSDLTRINDRRYELIKEYANEFGTMTNEQASSLLQRYMATDEQVVQLRQKYVPLFNHAVPGVTTATFFQIDRRIQNIIELQLASQIPLVQEQ